MVSVGLGVSGRQLSTVMKFLLLSLLSSLGGPRFQLIILFFFITGISFTHAILKTALVSYKCKNFFMEVGTAGLLCTVIIQYTIFRYIRVIT
jgi:hypothetical protein